MPTSFPISLNNFECLTTSDIPAGFGTDHVTLSAADYSRLWAACGATSYKDPNTSAGVTGYSVKFTLIHPSALDAFGRLIDPSKTIIITAGVSDPAVNTSYLLDIRPAYDTTTLYGFGFEGAQPNSIPDFPVGSYLRCEMTSGILIAIYKAINLIEAVTGTHLAP